jgi:hypothetical protein
MVCEILTEGVLKAALRRDLPADQRAILLCHLREPCEACLDLLESWTAEEIMLGFKERLTADDLRKCALNTQKIPARRRASRLARLAWGAVAAALVLVGLVGPPLNLKQRQAASGLKGGTPPAVTLIPLAGERTPKPHVVRALAAGGQLAPKELLLLRIRLNAPAWVYLLAQKQGEGEAAELIWPSQPDARHEAGEFELAESGSALAIDPAALGTGGRLFLIASPEPIVRSRLEVRRPLLTREDLQSTFAGCGVDLLPILVGPH